MRFIFLCSLSSLSLFLFHIEAKEVALPATLTDQFGIEFILVKAGQFKTLELDAETPQEETIELDHPFYLSKTEITQGQWERIMGSHTWQNSPEYNEFGGYGEGENFPVYFVSFADAQSFVASLNAKMSKPTYRLPTDKEWEYAARAGSTNIYSYGAEPESLGSFGWFAANADDTQEVANKRPNKWGFYDMHGNVWEWVLDERDDPYSLPPSSADVDNSQKRGGSWRKDAAGCQLTSVGVHNTDTREDDIGFRLLRMIEVLKTDDDSKTE